jgi:Cu2+-containing amine oxidase
MAGRDQYSTGDVWVTIYRGDGFQQGENVGFNCTDKELESNYAVGPLHPATTGDDLVFWGVVRHHHEPRFKGEEAVHLPYHFEEFSIVPRTFLDRRGPAGGG